jgi:hypothetical protein
MSSDEIIKVLELVWLVISGIAAAAWAAMPIIWPWLKRKYLEWHPPRLEVSQRGAKDLKHVVRELLQIAEWLSSTQTELVTKVRRDLCRVAWSIYLEALSYIALRSLDVLERELALRNLSQVIDAASVSHIKHVVRGIIYDEGAPNSVRKVAEAVLKELEEREEMEEQQA